MGLYGLLRYVSMGCGWELRKVAVVGQDWPKVIKEEKCPNR